MVERDISSESWREYEWTIPENGKQAIYRIVNPCILYYERGSSCHVVSNKDNDGNIIVHCIPSVGRFGCILRWSKNSPTDADVSFVSAGKNGNTS